MNWRRVLASWLLVFAVMTAGIEAGLQVVDPWNVKAARSGNLVLHFVDNERGYSLPPGEYNREYGAVTINRDLTRVVPDSNENGRRLIFLGDSVTFGVGVDDGETFVNLLAQRLAAHTVNAAFTGHNITYIQRSFEMYADPDALLAWLVIENDTGLEHDFPEDLKHPPNVFGFEPLLLRYWLQTTAVDATPRDVDNFYRRMDAITGEYDNLILFAFDDEWGRALAGRYDVNLIPWYTSHISRANSHPDVLGHVEVADSMQPILERAW
jgi:hypothetical protein